MELVYLCSQLHRICKFGEIRINGLFKINKLLVYEHARTHVLPENRMLAAPF